MPVTEQQQEVESCLLSARFTDIPSFVGPELLGEKRQTFAVDQDNRLNLWKTM